MMSGSQSGNVSQTNISRYFPSPSKKRAVETVDLTLDSDSDDSVTQSRKRAKTTGPIAGPSRVDEGASPENWRFTPSPQKSCVNSVSPEVHDAFRRRLLPGGTTGLRLGAARADSLASREESTTSPVGSGSDSDHAFQELSALFANKSKGKRKAPPTRTTNKTSRTKNHVLGPSGQPYTPLEEQVLKLKADNPGTVLMFEVGYKYRFFGEDAEIAAKFLGVVCYPDRNLVTAFIPVERKSVHLKNLLSQGYRVGVVNQTETAALKKVGDNRNEIFERKVTNLYTAATYIDELDSVDDTDKYISPPLMCLLEEPKGTDVIIAMITICPHTGDVVWDEFQDGIMRIELETRLVHTRPAELLLPAQLSKATEKMLSHFTNFSSTGKKTRIERFKGVMGYSKAFDSISNFYTDKNKAVVASESPRSGQLLAAITDFPKRVVIALAHAIKYLSAFGVADAFLETNFFTQFTNRTHMLLAANTLVNLEVYRNETDYTTNGSLVSVLDRTKTKFGARMLRNWVGRPLIDKASLQARVDAVEELKTTTSETVPILQAVLSKLPDLAKGLSRIQYGQCTPRELSTLLPAFQRVGKAFNAMASPSEIGFKSDLLNNIFFSLPQLRKPMEEVISQIILKEAAEGRREAMWTDDDKFPELEGSKLALQANEIDLMDQLKAIQKTLKRPSLKWTSVAGEEYLIELKRGETSLVPSEWHLVQSTKYVLRYHTPTVKIKTQERAQYTEAMQREAHRAYLSFLEEISQKHYAVMRDAVNKLAVADCLLSLAKVALENDYVRPEFTDNTTLEIVDGRHPMVEKLSPDPFVANSIDMGVRRPKSKIITGPNMGGKSCCVRMIALIVLMAQIGSYVPASSVKLGLVDAILTRMGASDDLARGRSTFMVEMSETSEILHLATQKSLVVLDELGRGTSTFDGMAIASAVLQHLIEVTNCKTLFITHYPSIAKELESKFPLQLQNLHMGYAAESRIDGVKDVTFLYQLTPGLSQESFGVECGRLAGLPENILEVASLRALILQDDVERRRVQNQSRKALWLLMRRISSPGRVGRGEIEELLNYVQTIHI